MKNLIKLYLLIDKIPYYIMEKSFKSIYEGILAEKCNVYSYLPMTNVLAYNYYEPLVYYT